MIDWFPLTFSLNVSACRALKIGTLFVEISKAISLGLYKILAIGKNVYGSDSSTTLFSEIFLFGLSIYFASLVLSKTVDVWLVFSYFFFVALLNFS